MLQKTHKYQLSFLYSLQISDDEIIVKYDFRTHRLAWQEITRVFPNPKGKGLLLTNSGEDTIIYINPNLTEYEQIVAIIRTKCAMAWNNNAIQVFHFSPLGLLVWSSTGLVTLLYAFGELTEGFLLPGLTSILMGLLLLFLAFSKRCKVYFKVDKLIIQYPLRTVFIHAKEIESIADRAFFSLKLGSKLIPIVFQPRLLIKLKTGKTIDLTGVREGEQALETMLGKWLKKYSSAT